MRFSDFSTSLELPASALAKSRPASLPALPNVRVASSATRFHDR
ncbi:Uncharacterised protein [Mycobacteroides abscessus subsp. abscessus]|nr:Uncharacterised protein [Mycobacteroides abscessus subsp. abscessus]